MKHVESYYAATANDHTPWPTLQESIQCDVCIIGAGFTGLSAALYLTEAGYDVVVLEAARVGFGTSPTRWRRSATRTKPATKYIWW